MPQFERSKGPLGMIDRFLYKVSGQSMEPTFQAGDLLLVSPPPSAKRPVDRGSIAIIRDTSDQQRLSLKRVIGLPEENLHFSEGLLFINDCHLIEPYLDGKPAYLGTEESFWKLGPKEYFVMGDNRLHSTDSRHTGSVQADNIVGVVKFKVWPLNRLGGPRGVDYKI